MSDLSLIEAVKGGDYAEVERLTKSGADINQQNERGWAALHFAAGRGDLPIVKLLVESGADIFKVGVDQRTPSAVALAAGRIPVIEYLSEVEDRDSEGRSLSPLRPYCKAYRLESLRNYSSWSESRINWKQEDYPDEAPNGPHFPDEKVVFIHEDFTVTESMWRNENVIFDKVDATWKEFCAKTLAFRVPNDIDLVISQEKSGA